MTGENISNEFLDFMINKAHQTYVETGKAVGNAVLTYLLLMFTTAVLVFGKGAETDKVSLPFVGLALNKPIASIVTLVVSCGVLYWLYSADACLGLIKHQFYELVKERFKNQYEHLQEKSLDVKMGYPSIDANIRNAAVLAPFAPSLVSSAVLIYGFVLMNYCLPLIFAWRIGGSFGLSLWGKLLLCGGVLILLIPSTIVRRTGWFIATSEWKTVHKRLEEDRRRTKIEEEKLKTRSSKR